MADNVLLCLHAGDAEDKARMNLLRQCCALFQGNHTFHNYTKRRLYRVPNEADPSADAGTEIRPYAHCSNLPGHGPCIKWSLFRHTAAAKM